MFVSELGLPDRIYLPLIRADIIFIEQLKQLIEKGGDEKLLSIPRIGSDAILTIRNHLTDYIQAGKLYPAEAVRHAYELAEDYNPDGNDDAIIDKLDHINNKLDNINDKFAVFGNYITKLSDHIKALSELTIAIEKKTDILINAFGNNYILVRNPRP